MSLYKHSFFALLLIFHALNGIGQDTATKTITTKELYEHLTIIASDSMMGRSFKEMSGLEMTADYLRQNAEDIVLNPAGKNFFQHFRIISSKPTEKCDSLFVFNKKKLRVKTNFIIGISQINNNPLVEGELVFAGFGWQDNEHEYDDLKGIDLTGKIVICSIGSPETYGSKNTFHWESQLEKEKTDRLLKKGARGVILVTNPADTEQNVFNRFRRRIKKTNYFVENKSLEGKLIAITLPEVADAILGGKNKYKSYLNSVSKKLEPNTFVAKNTFGRIKITRQTESLIGKNVIGIIEGSDSILKNECIIYMAHYDHLGTNNNGEVYNGADDNGSGTSALLELAEAFSSLEVKPSRSVAFVWVTGEEVGLLGSEYYTKNPAFPLEKTIACINLDMVGRVYEPRDSIWKKSPKMVKDFDGVYTLISHFSPKLKTVTDSICNDLGLIPDYSLPNNFFHSSDHHYFHINGVPVLNLATGYHADYHKVSDDISKINFEKMKRIADLAFWVGFEMANK